MIKSYADLMEKGRFNWDTGCIEWPFKLTEDGYGKTSFNGRMRLVHRQAMFLAGKMSLRTLNNPKKVVMHMCDNRACFNFGHLKVGTQLQNIRDRVKKGRCRKPGLRDPITKRFIKQN